MDLASENEQHIMIPLDGDTILDISKDFPSSFSELPLNFSSLVFNSLLQPGSIPSDMSRKIMSYLTLNEQLAFGRTSKQNYYSLYQGLQLSICHQRIQQVFATHDVDSMTNRDFAHVIADKANRLLLLTQKVKNISQESPDETIHKLGILVLTSFEREADLFFKDVEIAKHSLVFLTTNSQKDLDYLEEIYQIEKDPENCCDQFSLKMNTFCQDSLFAGPFAFLIVGGLMSLTIIVPFVI